MSSTNETFHICKGGLYESGETNWYENSTKGKPWQTDKETLGILSIIIARHHYNDYLYLHNNIST